MSLARRRKPRRDGCAAALPPKPGLARTCNRPHLKLSGHRARRGALPLIPGTTPRRRIATGRSPSWRGRPPLPRPRSLARLQPGSRRSWATSPRSAGQRSPGGNMHAKAAGSPAGSSRRAKRPRPGGLYWRRRRPRPGRRWRAIRPEAQSSRRRPGRPRAGRRGARDPGSRREPPCPAPVRRPP